MNAKKLAQLNQYIESADVALQQAREILAELGADKTSTKLARGKAKNLVNVDDADALEQDKIIEGVFNGQNMIGPDGKEYSVPANYASKSKLVEGDVLKLTIQDDGSFLYKQINPIPRTRIKGELVMDEMTGQYAVLANDGKKYNILTASITYFKGEVGEEVTILIPKDKTCQWAALENIISKTEKNKLTPQPFKQLINDIKESVDEIKPETTNYQGITQHAKPDSMLPEIDDLDNASINEDEQKSQQEREKIEQLINNENLDIDDLDKKDLEEI